MAIASEPFFFAMVYPLLPWTGLMLLGHGTAPLFHQPAQRRDARLIAWGVTATAANGWQVHDGAIRTLIDFLNITKYPPSLHFLLMTLGPAAILCASADRVPDAIKRPLIVFGRAPFAFYRPPVPAYTLSRWYSVSFRASMPVSS